MWVFAYGSLLWNPGFTAVESVRADLSGYTRSFCMWSIHHRGTEDHPGLVLALDTGEGTCAGVALRAADGDKDDVLAMLRERELISSAYYEDWLDLTLHDGRQVQAVTYIINRDHEQYCAGMALEQQAQVIARAVGGKGPNPEYLYNTANLLQDLDIPDPDMEWLTARVRALTSD
ncbi:MAG: gamma-glutamylcyclotransferase [Planktomarina sp.]